MKQLRKSISRSLVTLCLLIGYTEVNAITIDATVYFAYTEIPKNNRIQMQEFVMLSKKKCNAINAPQGAKQATYLVVGNTGGYKRERPGCWIKFEKPLIAVCRVGEGESPKVGNDCHDIPQEEFIDTSSLPKTPKF